MKRVYKLVWKKKAEKYLLKMNFKYAYKIRKNMREIARGNIENKDIKKEKGEINKYRFRIGDYRVIYEKFDTILTINVEKVGPRGDVYK